MSDNIKVVVKVRPLISREVEEKLGYRWRVRNNTLTQLDPSGKETDVSYTFDKVYDKETKTEVVYNDVAKPIVEAAIAGFNGTIFAYGQTSSGKTFTMTGTEESPGIIPLAVINLFKMIKNQKDRDFLVRVSYIEIYNETLKDLLNVEKKDIKIRDTLQGVKVECSESVTGSPEEVLEAMKKGEANRQTGSTVMNEESSRSHSIFQITIESREHVDGEDEESGSVNVSQLNLVDLAGSERAGQTGATGIRFKEGTHINKSLSALALVIKQLSEEQKYTNYRDSKLTRILQNSLGGNAKTSIICAVTPASVEETVSTLQFANRAKSIKNKPEVNAVATSATMIQGLTKELAKLQSELAAKRNLEVMLESSKNVEQELQNKIATLQKLILNGFGQMSVRKPPPRRVTISAPSHHVREEPQSAPLLPSFCTPGLKYNPLVTPMTDFSSVQSARKLPTVPEEGRMLTPPPAPAPPPPPPPPPASGGAQLDPDEVIEIDSDDDVVTEKHCSPYHKCYGASKTPPCVLRKNAKVAEKNFNDLLELTEREKIYTPSVVEFIEKLEQNTIFITQLEEEIDALKEQSKDKDCKIEELTNKIKQTEEEVANKIKQTEKEIAAINKAKSQLEVKCKANDNTITELEVSYETLKKKSKTREQELLSLLDEQQNNRAFGNPKKMESEMLNFMDLSKDISLVQSDNDNTSHEEGSSQVHDLVNNIQGQLATKHSTVLQLETDLNNQKQKIDSLETSTRQLQATIDEFKYKLENVESENSLLKSTIENLNTTIQKQKENLESAHRDMQSYNSTIQELQIKLTAKENILNKKINDSVLDSMIANEQKVIANNDNINNIIHSLKVALVNRNKEIDSLKSTIDNNASNNALEKQLEIKERQINTLIEEAEKLKDQLSENNSIINKLSNQLTTIQEENEALHKQNQDIQEENKTLHSHNNNNTSQIENLQRQNSESEIQISNLQSDNERLTRTVAEKEVNELTMSSKNEELLKNIDDLTYKICNLEKDLNMKLQEKEQIMSSQNEDMAHKINALEKALNDKIQENENLSYKLGETELSQQNMSSNNRQLTKQIEEMTQKLCYLEHDLNEKDKMIACANNDTEKANNDVIIKAKIILRKVFNVISQLNGSIEYLPESDEDLTEILEMVDSSIDVLDGSAKQTLQNKLGLEEKFSKLTLDHDSQISLFKAELEKSNSETAAQSEKLITALEKMRSESDIKDQEIIKLKEKLDCVVSAAKDKDPKSREHLDTGHTILLNLHSITSKLKASQVNIPSRIDNFEELFNIFGSELNRLESSLSQTIHTSLEFQEKLLNLTANKEAESSNLESQIETINNEMKVQTKEMSEKTKHLVEELKNTRHELESKIQEAVELEIELNDAKENNENLRNDLLSKDNSITLLHEKLKSLYSEIAKLRDVNKDISLLEDLLKEKTARIQSLEENLSGVVGTLEEKYKHVTNQLEDSIQNRDKLLVEILKKAGRVARQCGVDTNREENADNVYEHVVLILDKIGINIELLKTENDVERSDIEEMLTVAREEIEKLTELNKKLKNACDDLYYDNQELQLEIQRVKKISLEVLDTPEILEQLNLELQSKSRELKSMENKAVEWKEQFKTHESTISDQINKLVSENDKLKELQKRHSFLSDCVISPSLRNSLSMAETENSAINAPQSLLTICCNKIMDVIQSQEVADTTTTSSSSKFSIPSENVQVQATKCDCNRLTSELSIASEENLKLVEDLSKATAENLQLVDLLKDLQASNDYLLCEREEVRKEIQTLVEPASELHKKLTNHRTNLSTLTATTYAENKLLHSQLKVLRHHHTRYTHVCQRDLPAFKNLLNDLMTILKDSSFAEKENNSFKRYSLPDVLDNSTSNSTFKNESTLDGDLLMLDTNLTMTTVNSTLVGPDQTYVNVTQVNFDGNDTTCQADISKIIDPYLVYSQMETLSNDNQKLSEQVCKLEQENCKLTKEVQTLSMPSTAYKDTQCSPIKMHSMNDANSVSPDIVCKNCNKMAEELRIIEDNMSAKTKLLLKEIEDLEAEKTSILEKYTNLTLEMPSTDALVRKLSNLEKDFTEKIQEINKLNNEIKKKSKMIKELQDENDTLSMQVMDNISESDLLRKELDELKESSYKLIKKCSDLEKITKEYELRISNEGCSQCSVKDDLIKSLQLEHLKFNRSFSDSESSSTHNKICTLQNELHASKEDCKKITEEVVTIKNQLERGNISMCQAMDLDESMSDSSVFAISKHLAYDEQRKSTNIPENKLLDLYTKEKMDCFNFYVNKIGTGKEGLDENVKIIDIMTAFYNNIVTKHGNEVENLLNKLNEYEELKINLETQLSNIKTECSEVTKELQENQMNIKTVTDVLEKIRSNVDVLNQEMYNVVDVDKHTKAATLFKENLLKVIDSELGLSCVNIFDTLVDSIVNKHQKDLSVIMQQYTKLQINMENVVTELNTVNENIKQMKSQLSERESECNLLKAQKEKVHEINNAVTMDIVHKEKELAEMLANSYRKLVELEIVAPYNIDMNLPFNENIKVLFDQIINNCQNISTNAKENQNLELEINKLKTTLEQKEELLNTLQQKVVENEKDLQSHKSRHEDLSMKLEKTLEDNKTYLETIEKMTKEISALQTEMHEKQKSKDLVKECELCIKLRTKIEICQQDYENLKTTNEILTNEKESIDSELDKAQEIIFRNKTELDKMTSDILVLRETVKDNVNIIEKLKLEAKSLVEQNVQLKKQFEEKNHECSRLETNIKTHEKSVEIQSRIIIRLKKQKEEDDKASKEKDERLDKLTEKCATLQKECEQMKHELEAAKEEVESLKNKKDSLETKVNELEMNLMQDGHKRKSIDAIADASRRRRQSLYDSKRAVEEQDQYKVEALFGSRARPDDLFMDVDVGNSSSNRSTPQRLSRGRDLDDSSVQLTRRRRQSIHDQHRMPTHSPETPQMLPLITNRTEQSSGDVDTSVVAQLRDRLASTEQELEELKEKYREVDEECEICSQYLQERDAQCSRLVKEKLALERQVAKLNEKLKFNPKPNYAHAAVNTDKDWANLHSVVVDRMSFDAEVEKNKKLSRIIDELRCNKQELKDTIAKMQKALEKNATFMHSKELAATKAELLEARKELSELQARHRELDEECETCARYLRERDDQCRRLRDAKRALEKKLEDLEGDISSVSAATRRKRQSAHDHNRSPQPRAGSVHSSTAVDKHTEIGDELLSHQVERDDNALKASNTQMQELQRVKMALERASREKAALESQLRDPALHAAGSAIVQSQQLTDLLKENHKLKKINAKLISLCKKRGKLHDSNRENEEPSDLG